MDKLIEELSSNLDLKKFHLNKFSPKIFICGGKIGDNNRTRYLSIRDYIYKKIKKENNCLFSRLILAEDINKWFFGDNHYENLLDLEEDLAGLVVGIPIFVESPGSLAELGAFSMIPEIEKKLVVFISEKYFGKESFICLGPLKKIEDIERIRIYNFKQNNKNYYIEYDFKEIEANILKDVEDYSVNKPFKRKFNQENTAHLTFLICNIIFITRLVKRKEIILMLSKLSIEIRYKELNKILWVAEKMQMIKHTYYGDTYFYTPLNIDSEYISFGSKINTADWHDKFYKYINLNYCRKNAFNRIKGAGND